MQQFTKEKKPFKCINCDKNFTVIACLKSHIESVHKGKKSFKCNFCDRNFTQKGSLGRHISSVHEGKSAFKCDICNKGFAKRLYLTNHLTRECMNEFVTIESSKDDFYDTRNFKVAKQALNFYF